MVNIYLLLVYILVVLVMANDNNNGTVDESKRNDPPQWNPSELKRNDYGARNGEYLDSITEMKWSDNFGRRKNDDLWIHY